MSRKKKEKETYLIIIALTIFEKEGKKSICMRQRRRIWRMGV